MLYSQNYLKNTVFVLFVLTILSFTACEKDTSNTKKYDSYTDFLKDKTIISIVSNGSHIWFQSTELCNDCNVPLEVSSLPYNHYLTWKENEQFDYYKIGTSYFYLKIDRNNELVIFDKNVFHTVKHANKSEFLCETNDFVSDFAFDTNNQIWISTQKGIKYRENNQWNNFSFLDEKYNTASYHQIVIDKNNRKWLSFQDYATKLVYIDNNTTKTVDLTNEFILLNDENLHYFIDMKTDKNNHFWLAFYNDAYHTNLIKYNGNEWKLISPENENEKVEINKIDTDSEGNIVVVYEFRNTPNRKKVARYIDNEFKKIENNIESVILCTKIIGNKIYYGTINGVIEETF